MKTHFKYIALGLMATLAVQAKSTVKDKAYYEAHIDEAIAKIEDCEASVRFAIESKNEERYKEISRDKECNTAHKVRVAYKIKQREKERIAQKAEQQKLFDAEYNKHLTEFQSLDYADLQAYKRECNYDYDFIAISPKCKAYEDIVKKKKEDEEKKKTKLVETITKKYNKQSLLEYKNKTCKGAGHGNTECELARRAFKKEQQVQVENYHSNEDLLKKDFNECQREFTNLNKKSKYNEAKALKNTYKCSTVAKAALKLKVYGWFQPIK